MSSSSSASSSFGGRVWPKLLALVAAVGTGLALGVAISSKRQPASSSHPRAGQLRITNATRELYRKYEAVLVAHGAANRPPLTDALIEQRFWAVYERAMASKRYRCIEERRFMEPRISLHPFYETLIGPISSMGSSSLVSPPAYPRCPRMKFRERNQIRLLDVSSQRWMRHSCLRASLSTHGVLVFLFPVAQVGCCLGTDLRQLVADGFQPENLLGLDVNDTFINLGQELLFDDANGPMAQRFCAANILDPNPVTTDPSGRLERFAIESIDVIYIGSVYHLFSLPDTLRLSENLFRLVIAGGCIFGRTVGVDSEQAEGFQTGAPALGTPSSSIPQLRYLHSPASLKKQLESVGFTDVKIVCADVDMSNDKVR
jgi:hypothetical protein